MKTKLPHVADLSCACVDVKPIDVDWSRTNEETIIRECSRCEKCGAVLDATTGEDRHSRIDLESECDGYVPPSEGPMMNYFYPLNGDEADAELLVDLPVCAVERDGESGFALTGGGMDLSWEICEAYMRLGYLPPVHFADLPAMAGKKLDERTSWVLRGVERSCEVVSEWMKSRQANVRATRLAMNKASKKGAA